MIITSRKNGRLDRQVQMADWSLEKGLPSVSNRAVISQMGWASRDELLRAGVGPIGSAVPQLWLCGGSGVLPPVSQQFSLPLTAERELIQRNGKSVGVKYEDDDAVYVLLSGLLPTDPQAAPEKQTFSVFEEMEAALQSVGMEFAHVARTWLYMDRILDWYDAFNQARDAFFRSRKVYDGLVPASTGIGSANLIGTAITAGALAVLPKQPNRVTVERVDSPLQCTAHAYGSSFSRAVEIGTPGFRYLTISGTASIEPGGKTAHIGDTEKQLELTLDVVEAILTSRKMNWAQTARGIMYLKDPSFLPAWEKIRETRGLKDLPIITLHADVCRDDLLVELELDAVDSHETPQ